MPISNTVNSYLHEHNIQFDLLPHSISHCSLETARKAHVDEDHVAKAVVVKDENGYAMVVVPADGWVKMNKLQAELNREFELADESELKSLFSDCKTGAIPALGQAYQLDTYFDEQLNSLANVYFEAGDHEHLVHLHGDEFRALFRGVRHGHFCH
ncbi:MAG: YbaK/EbsC family protein [Gammaproteobacteria bacterium]|nr:YbaK/EbsC family protein [Gammaproteobacteria bacterium]